eukprot:CAMPEP_0172151472 /NCGR_PEP_ID=MMETSP1050-20130122/248_1 /TAXON_ID=233186 /ORGANISM="Cryptomonas curvata, Strain CCAP979/52" /LENGTH=62 /DNA_ID=CAMNT_0012819581 /DNA_START=894 /DNA_END=1079 /DNA_ORIENTATION=-
MGAATIQQSRGAAGGGQGDVRLLRAGAGRLGPPRRARTRTQGELPRLLFLAPQQPRRAEAVP